MGASRKIKLDSQGEIDFFEDIANGTSKIAVKAPASLAADVTLTLPENDGTAGQFLTTDGSGVMSWAGGSSTLDQAYDNGSTVTADSGPVTIDTGESGDDALYLYARAGGYCLYVNKSGTGEAILVEHEPDSHAVEISKTGSGGGDGILVENAGTGIGIEITQTGAGPALYAYQAEDYDAVRVAKEGTGSGSAIAIQNDGTGTGLDITQDGAGNGIVVTQVGSANAIYVTQGTGNAAISVAVASVAGGAGIYVHNDGTGYALDLKQDGAGSALNITTTAGAALRVNGLVIQTGSGSPENTITAAVGSLYMRTDGGAGTSLYVKESGAGNTGWIGK